MWPNARSSDSRPVHQVGVLGLGRFALSLAEELHRNGVEVLGADAVEENVNRCAPFLTHAVIMDTTNSEALRQFGVGDLEFVVVGIGSNIENSVLTASAVVDLGVPQIWAKADNEAHAKILHQIGVHHVVRPEREAGRRVAHLLSGGLQEFVDLGEGFVLARTHAPEIVLGVPLGKLESEKRGGVEIIGVRRPDGSYGRIDDDTVLTHGDVVIATGPPRAVDRFAGGQ